MEDWLEATLVAAAAVVIILIFIVVIAKRRCICPRKRKEVNINVDAANREELRVENPTSLQTKLHHVSLHHHLDRDGSKRTNYYVFRRGVSTKPFFSWSDHPSLVTDAVENGWSRFAFTTYASSPSIRSAMSLLGPCAVGVGDHDRAGRSSEVEISWEVSQGSADFLQKIRLNYGLRKNIPCANFSSAAALMTAKSVIRTALPLPGPPLGNSAFPQEAYFEITVLPSEEDEGDHVSVGTGTLRRGRLEGEKAKLIQQDFNARINMPDSLVQVTTSHSNGNRKLEDFKIAGKDDGKAGGIVLSLGLSAGGSLPLKLPGTYPGSIGFNSDGSVNLDGIKLIYESEKEDWGRGGGADVVIGCGYNPIQKKVFFTVDSQLIHEIYCKSEEFGTPLYPTLAANSEITVLVNLGQCAFKYGPANLQRTPNPCFIGPLASSPVIGYEDSKELFSMGRIDSLWLNRSTTRNTNTNTATAGNIPTAVEFDEESEGDLFEIVLDRTGKSPNTL